MPKKRKKFRSADEAKKSRENKALWQEVLKKHGASGKKEKLVAVAKPPFLDPVVRREVTKYPDNFLVRLEKAPSGTLGVAPLSPAMAERERKAQEEIAKKKLRVAPLYNKGGLQFISDGEDLTTIGKKI